MKAEPKEADPREFLERFRHSLQARNPEAEGEVPQSLLRYGQLCEEANRRLRECYALIQRGQYSNAVELAEQEPNLRVRCELLEIPERDLLADFAHLLGAKPPVLVNRDLVAAVQEAYQNDTTAAGNRRVLHRLTLVRAPLPARIAVMRRLLIQNPNHPFLEGDIRTFERAWFKLALPFVRPFAKEGRSDLIEEVVQDLEQGDYLEDPPSALISQLRAQLAKAQAAQLPMLAAEIRRAFAERSISTLTQLAERWNSQVGSAGTPDTDVSFGVAEALDWLRKSQDEERGRKEKDEATSRLTAAMQAPGSMRIDPEIAYRGAKVVGAVHDLLGQRLRSRLASMDRDRKALVVGFGLPAVVVGLVILIVAWKAILVGVALAAMVVVGLVILSAAWTAWSKGPRNGGDVVAGGTPVVAERAHDSAPKTRIAPTPSSERLGEQDTLKVDSSDVLREKLTEFRKEMEGARGTNESLESLARFLRDKIDPISPDPEVARRAKLVKDALPKWIKTLEVQRLLQSGDFLNHPISDDDWKGQPPSGALAAAAEYVEMVRNRNPAIAGTEAASLKERLARMDIVNLWVVRRAGETARYYTKRQPAAGQASEFVNVLLDSTGRQEGVEFVGAREVNRAAQSVFAERAAELWDSPDPDEWNQHLADIHDTLLELSDMDPLLKLDLVRRFLVLAVRTSTGYREIVEKLPEFKEVTGRSGLITGNWLNPSEDLDNERERAGDLMKAAPRLSRQAGLAANRDEQWLITLKQALVATGWICQDGEGHAMLVRFDGVELAAGSRLYTVADGGWIDLGVVSGQGKEIRFNVTAGEYVGWPVFALLLPNSVLPGLALRAG